MMISTPDEPKAIAQLVTIQLRGFSLNLLGRESVHFKRQMDLHTIACRVHWTKKNEEDHNFLTNSL